jgi:hypothetical protein
VFFDREKHAAKPHDFAHIHHTFTTNLPSKKHHKTAKSPVKTEFHHAEKNICEQFQKSSG